VDPAPLISKTLSEDWLPEAGTGSLPLGWSERDPLWQALKVAPVANKESNTSRRRKRGG